MNYKEVDKKLEKLKELSYIYVDKSFNKDVAYVDEFKHNVWELINHQNQVIEELKCKIEELEYTATQWSNRD